MTTCDGGVVRSLWFGWIAALPNSTCREGVGFATGKRSGLVFNAEFSVYAGIGLGRYKICQPGTNKLPALKNRFHSK